MSIDNIVGINHNSIEQFRENNSLKQIERANNALNTSEEGNSPGNTDSVVISNEARALHNILSNLRPELDKIGDVRKDKIEDAKERMESGFYNSSETIEKVASSLLNAAFRPLGI